METTRHFVSTVFAVHDGAVALHEHDGLGRWLPPGGHIEHGELPREAARREVREELGLPVALLGEPGEIASDLSRELPGPAHLLVEDINVYPDGEVGHQHLDFVYYGALPSRDIDPAPGEAPAAAWRWFEADDLRSRDAIQSDIAEIGQRAIDAVRAAD